MSYLLNENGTKITLEEGGGFLLLEVDIGATGGTQAPGDSGFGRSGWKKPKPRIEIDMEDDAPVPVMPPDVRAIGDAANVYIPMPLPFMAPLPQHVPQNEIMQRIAMSEYIQHELRRQKLRQIAIADDDWLLNDGPLTRQ